MRWIVSPGQECYLSVFENSGSNHLDSGSKT